MTDIRVRIAPSPTGDPHVGTAYIGLFNMAFARHEGGRFILRIEDTDRARSTKESEQAIFDTLRWIGLEWDEGPDVGGDYGPYRQSERLDIYREYAQKLVDAGAAYYCFCTPERLAQLRERQRKEKKDFGYDGLCRRLSPDGVQAHLDAGDPHVIRLKVPRDARNVEFDDLVRKHVSISTEQIDDQVLIKSDGFPTYHLANVVDDHLMEITHVIRAEEWISSVPKHVLLYEAFGWEHPVYVHMPLLRNKDKSKISKRKNPVSLHFYRSEGYLPEAMLNFLANLGWSMSDAREEFTLKEMIDDFSWDRVSTSAPVFDMQKLDWLNGVHIRRLPLDEFRERITPYTKLKLDTLGAEKLQIVMPLLQERLKRLSQVDEVIGFLFTDELDYETVQLIQKKQTAEEVLAYLKESAEALAGIDEWKTEQLEAAGRAMCDKLGTKPGKLFMNLRIAVTGSRISPPLFESMEVLGREACLRRIGDAIRKLLISEQ